MIKTTMKFPLDIPSYPLMNEKNTSKIAHFPDLVGLIAYRFLLILCSFRVHLI